MRRTTPWLAILALSLAPMGTAHAETAGRAAAAPVRPAAFAQCAACHSAEPGKTVFGPSLYGVAGRRAGSLPGYDYSPALRNARITWNAQTLDRWLTAPQKTVPGTRMPFGGIQERASRKAVIDYLLSLKAK